MTTTETTPRQPTILVVDDEAPIRHFLKVLLERLGYDVDTATGGPHALRKAEQKEYDVLLTDLIMPRMDGLEVIRRFRESYPETESVMITGYPSSETIIAATRAGALDYLPKSPDPEHLSVLIEKAMQVKALRRKAAERDIYARMAQMDGLTELFTRTTFLRSLEAEFNRSQRASSPLSMLLVGVDGYRELRAEHGEEYGDRILRSVADSLRTSCRNYDILARYGDDEFAVLAPNTDRDGSQTLAGRIRIDAGLALVASDTPPGVFLGGATFPFGTDNLEQLVGKAEAALAEARIAGGGSILID